MMLDKDTRVCISLSGRPSNIGTRFHNYLYGELGLNYVYKAFETTDLVAAVNGIRGLGIRGAGVSMPFKEQIVELVDVMHDSASAIDSVNTVVNDDGVLHAYNTDYQAVAVLLRENQVSASSSVALAGSGGMAKAVIAALRDHGVTDVIVVSRNAATGPALADRYGFTWRPELGDDKRELLVNTTPIGMAGGTDAEEMPFSAAAVSAADIVFDVVAMPPDTPLVRLATDEGKTVITGAQVIALQAAEQFALYTGVRPSADHIRRASEFSRARDADPAPTPAPPRASDFSALWPVPTRWEDNDHYGHVNNVTYYSYFDTAVNAWLMATTGVDIRDLPAIGVVAETSCTYLSELTFPDRLQVGLSVERLGNRSIVYALAIFREVGGELVPAAVGRFVHVYVDTKTRTPVPIPPQIRDAANLLVR